MGSVLDQPDIPVELSPEFIAHNDGNQVIGSSIAFIIIAPLVVALRFWARYHKRAPIGADDWLILASLPFFFITNAFAIRAVQIGGVGRHLVVVLGEDPRTLTRSIQCLYVSEFSYTTLLTLVKLSILCLYNRVFPTPFMRKACAGMGIVCIAWWIANIAVTIWQCTPIWKAWEPFYLDGHCIDLRAFFTASSVTNIVIDAAMLALPAFEVKKLQMRKSLKTLLIGIFLLGGGVVVVSCIRLDIVIKMNAKGKVVDFTLLMVPSWIWTNCESTMAILCATLPTLQPVLRLVFGRLFASSTSNPNSHSDVVTIGGSGGSKNTKGSSVTTSQVSAFRRLADNDSAEDPMLWAKTDQKAMWQADVRANDVKTWEGIPMKSIRVQKDVEQNATGGR